MTEGRADAVRPAAVRAAGWGWRHAGRRAWAVSGLDLDVRAGERVLLVGASGSGKSTLLAALAGVLGGDEEGESSGTLTVGGADPSAARGVAGLVLQDPDAQVVAARVGDDVAFGPENLGVPRDEIRRRVRSALDLVGLDVDLDRSTSALSGGQRQRLALAGVLALRPGLLLLDEPTANLDPDGVVEVRDAVARVARETGATLVVVEHRTAVWADVVERVVALDAESGVVADGPPAVVLDPASTSAGRLREAGVRIPGDAVPRHPAAEPGDVLLRTEDLVIGRSERGRRGAAHPVAAGLALEVRAGEALAITGPNGAGKSTLALTLGGLLPALGGRVIASTALSGPAGTDPARWSSAQLAARIGTVFQNPEHQFLARTVAGELAVGPRALRLPPEEGAARIDELLVRLRLAPLAQANPFTLSGGQKRRLSVGTALATRPTVLILDEPTFGQDAVTWAEIVALLAELRDEGRAIVVVTHDEDLVVALGARRLHLADGRLAGRPVGEGRGVHR